MEIINTFISTLFGSSFAFVAQAAQLAIAADATAGQITTGRARALVAAAVGLISIILAVAAPGRGGNSRAGRSISLIAIVLGLTGAAVSVVHIAGSGGFGTGGGRAGAIVGLILGLIGTTLAGTKHIRITSGRQSHTAN